MTGYTLIPNVGKPRERMWYVYPTGQRDHRGLVCQYEEMLDAVAAAEAKGESVQVEVW